MADDTIRLPSGRELNQQQLFGEYVKLNPDDRTATPEGVWNYHVQLAQQYPDQYKLNTGKGYVGQLVSNIPGSVANFAKGVAGIVNPQTYKDLYQIGKGLYVNSIVPEDMRTPDQQVASNAAEGFKDYIKNRYTHPFETLKNDPMGAVADVSAVAGGASAVGRGAEAVTGSSAAANFARVARNVSEATNPTVWVTRGAAKLADKAGLADYLYRSSLVPLADQSVQDVDNAVRFGLRDAKVVAGRKGSARLARDIKATTQEMDDAAFRAEQQGRRYDPMAAGGAIDEVTANATGASNTGKTSGRITASRAFHKDYVNTLNKQKQEFLESHGATFDKNGNMLTPPSDVSPVDARAIWKGSNAELGDLTTDKPSDLSAKAASLRAVRQSIVDDFRSWFPGLKDAGQREALMIDLKNMIDAEIKRGLGVGSPSSNVYALAHTGQAISSMHASPIAIATFAKHVFSPELRSKIALQLANRHPALVRTYGAPAFWTMALAGRSQQEPPAPKQEGPITVDVKNWMDQVPEAHQ